MDMWMYARYKDVFSLSRNFYVRTHLKFTRVSKIEAKVKGRA